MTRGTTWAPRLTKRKEEKKKEKIRKENQKEGKERGEEGACRERERESVEREFSLSDLRKSDRRFSSEQKGKSIHALRATRGYQNL